MTDNKMLPEELMLELKKWAVIGANQNPEKFGNMIYNKLKRKGYTVYPVNPVYKDIDGDPCYASLADLPEIPEVLNMVVSPKRTKLFLQEAHKLGIKNIWLQPGTFDDEVLAMLKEFDMNAVQACVLVATR